MRLLAAAGALVSACLAAAPAAAQAEDQAAARVLFAEGRRLMKEGQYEQACPKLEAASKLHPGSGVRLNLADCFEHIGRIASAWAEFGEAAAVAKQSNRSEDELEAHKRQAALEPRLSRVLIRVTRSVDGLVVKRDGRIIDRGAWDTPLPVDPGNVALTAEAAGYAPWSQSIKITAPGTTNVVIPALAQLEGTTATPAPTEPHEKPPSWWTGRRALGVAMTGAGVVGAAVGGVLALSAKSQYNTAENESGAARHNDSVSAVNTGNVASVVLCVGAGVAAGGLVVWVTAPSTTTTVGTNGSQLFVRGTF